MKTRYLYLILAVIGAAVTWYFNIQFYRIEEDTSILNFISQTVTTIPAKSISADISVVAITFLIWMTHESLRIKIKHWWIIIPLTFFIALAFSFPLFLYLRSKRLHQINIKQEL